MIETSFSGYSGTDFLIFYGLLGLAAIVASIWMASFLREDGHDGPVSDYADWAYLAGGSRRLVEATLARLIGAGAITVTDKRRMVVSQPDAAQNAMEKALLVKVGDFGMKSAHASLSGHAEEVDRRLVDRGLLIDRSGRISLKFMTALPFLVLLAVGAYRVWAGLQVGEPVGFLIAMMVFFVVVMFIRLGKFNPRTRAGDAALASGMATQSRLRSAPQNSEMGTGVALFGTAVLVGTPFSELHAMRNAAGANGSGGYAGDGDSSSDSGGDGGCGGGCGGCGG